MLKKLRAFSRYNLGKLTLKLFFQSSQPISLYHKRSLFHERDDKLGGALDSLANNSKTRDLTSASTCIKSSVDLKIQPTSLSSQSRGEEKNEQPFFVRFGNDFEIGAQPFTELALFKKDITHLDVF